MKIKFYIHKPKKLIIERFFGHLSLAKLQESFPHIWNHPDYDPEYNGIIDFRHCEVHFSKVEFKAMIDQLNSDERSMTAKAAIMVSQPIAAAMAVMYSEKATITEDVGVFVYDSKMEEFLGLENSVFELLDSEDAVEIEV